MLISLSTFFLSRAPATLVEYSIVLGILSGLPTASVVQLAWEDGLDEALVLFPEPRERLGLCLQARDDLVVCFPVSPLCGQATQTLP